jgi:hypothetical protein
MSDAKGCFRVIITCVVIMSAIACQDGHKRAREYFAATRAAMYPTTTALCPCAFSFEPPETILSMMRAEEDTRCLTLCEDRLRLLKYDPMIIVMSLVAIGVSVYFIITL